MPVHNMRSVVNTITFNKAIDGIEKILDDNDLYLNIGGVYRRKGEDKAFYFSTSYGMIRYSKKPTVPDDTDIDNWSQSDWLDPNNTVADFAYNFTASDGKNILYGREKDVTSIDNVNHDITTYGWLEAVFSIGSDVVSTSITVPAGKLMENGSAINPNEDYVFELV